MERTTHFLSIAIITMIFLITITQNIYASSFEEKFEWVKKTFEENDAGVPHILERRGQAAYEIHNREILERIRKAESLNQAVYIMKDWLQFFRRGHHDIIMTNSQPTNANEQFDVTGVWDGDISAFYERIANQTVAGLEGIWMIGTQYKIGIVKEGDDYIGFIIESEYDDWLPNMIKLKIEYNEGNVVSTFYLRNFSPEVSSKPSFIGNNILRMGSRNISRLDPTFDDEPHNIERYLRFLSTQIPYIERINENTLYMRIHTFHGNFAGIVNQLVNDNFADLTSTPNLIIDIRGNPGGDNVTFEPILPLLYTNPFIEYNAEFLVGPETLKWYTNLSQNREFWVEQAGMDDDDEIQQTMDIVGRMLEMFSDKEREFVSINWDMVRTNEKPEYTVLEYPKNVGVIIDGASASASELFTLYAKSSRKTKIFGQRTMGSIDTGTQLYTQSPCEEIWLMYSANRFSWVPELLVDEAGIAPDFLIDRSVLAYRWVEHVTEIMNSWVTEPEPRRRRGRR